MPAAGTRARAHRRTGAGEQLPRRRGRHLTLASAAHLRALPVAGRSAPDDGEVSAIAMLDELAHHHVHDRSRRSAVRCDATKAHPVAADRQIAESALAGVRCAAPRAGAPIIRICALVGSDRRPSLPGNGCRRWIRQRCVGERLCQRPTTCCGARGLGRYQTRPPPVTSCCLAGGRLGVRAAAGGDRRLAASGRRLSGGRQGVGGWLVRWW